MSIATGYIQRSFIPMSCKTCGTSFVAWSKKQCYCHERCHKAYNKFKAWKKNNPAALLSIEEWLEKSRHICIKCGEKDTKIYIADKSKPFNINNCISLCLGCNWARQLTFKEVVYTSKHILSTCIRDLWCLVKAYSARKRYRRKRFILDRDLCDQRFILK